MIGCGCCRGHILKNSDHLINDLPSEENMTVEVDNLPIDENMMDIYRQPVNDIATNNNMVDRIDDNLRPRLSDVRDENVERMRPRLNFRPLVKV